MAQRNDEHGTDENQQELARLADITTECQEIYENVLKALKTGEILPLATQVLLQQHLEATNNVSVIKMVETRLAMIKGREIAILIGGEFNAGKSTFVNILMGGEYLPMDRGKVTHVVCEIRHCELRWAILLFEDDKSNIEFQLSEESADGKWNTLRKCIRTKTFEDLENGLIRTVKRIVICWPLAILEGMLGERKTIQEAVHNAQTGEGQSWNLPPEALSRLRRPYAGSLRGDNQENIHDPDETFRKEVVADNGHIPEGSEVCSPAVNTGAQLPRSEQLEIRRTVIIRRTVDINTSANTEFVPSYEKASDFTPGSQRNKHSSQYYSGFDDSHQTDTMTVYGHEAETNPTSPNQALEESSGSDEIYPKTVYENAAETNETIPMQDETKQVSSFKFAVLDCPGINPDPDGQLDTKDTPEYTSFIGEIDKCQTFIFIIDTTKDEGVNKHGIKILMEGIEENFKERNKELNPDQALFVANKADRLLNDPEKSEKLKTDVTQKLAETWPLLRKEHVLPFRADRVLEECIDSPSNEILQKMQRLLLKSMRLTLEEHCIWLLRMLEIAHAMARLGKQSSPIINKLSKTLDKVKEDAVKLQEEARKISDDKACRQAWADLKDVLQRHNPDIHMINWTNDEIEAEIPKTDAEWQDIYESVHRLIGKKVGQILRHAATELKQKYNRKFDELYRDVDVKFEKIKAVVSGLEEMRRDDGGLGSGLFTLLAPAAISVSIRAAPIVYPFVFLAAPILPIGLFGQLVIEDIRDSMNESRKNKFKDNKIEFMRQEANRIVKLATNELKENEHAHESPLFKYFFGENRKKIIHLKTEKLLEVLEILQETTYESECNQQSSKRHLLDMMKFYVVKVMEHKFTERSDILWIRNEEDNRRTIDQGTNACTYEAKLSERFGFTYPVAVKEFRCKLESTDQSASLPREIDAYRECYYLRQLSNKGHDKLVNFLGTGTSTTDGYLNLRIVMERYSGNLRRHVIECPRKPSIPEHREEFIYYAMECSEGLKFLHDNNILHRDVKPSNFLIKKGTTAYAKEKSFYSVVITDIGCAKAEEANCTLGQELGTPVYWAPEISTVNTFHSKPSDIFSLGLVLWEIWVRKTSYDQITSKRRSNLLAVVKREDIPVVANCLMEDPRKRISATNLLEELRTIDN